jgi:hypothetical protein
MDDADFDFKGDGSNDMENDQIDCDATVSMPDFFDLSAGTG